MAKKSVKKTLRERQKKREQVDRDEQKEGIKRESRHSKWRKC